MDLLDTTIVNIAIPSIQTELGASYAAIQWITAGYALAFATLLITGGRLGDVVKSATEKAISDNFANAFKMTIIYAIGIVGMTFLISFLTPRKIEYLIDH